MSAEIHDTLEGPVLCRDVTCSIDDFKLRSGHSWTEATAMGEKLGEYFKNCLKYSK